MADKPRKELDGRSNMSPGMKVAVGVFAVIMALSMMLPSLTSIFANNGNEEEQAEQSEATQDQTEETTDEESKDDESKDGEEGSKDEESDPLKDVPDNESLKSLAETNAPKVQKYEERLEQDENNLAALLNLANTYMNWGYSATYSGTTDEEKAYAQGLLDTAIDYYDRYLELNDSNAAKVDRALCQFYKGDTDEAIKALEKLGKKNPDFPLVWANLGMLYEQEGESKKANDAYHKAVETDPDDRYGAKSYGNSRLISLNATVDSPSDAGDATIEPKTETGLTSTLADSSGVGF